MKIPEAVVRQMIENATSDLRKERDNARHVVVEVATGGDRDLSVAIGGWYSLENVDQVFAWWYKAIDSVIKLAKVLPGNTSSPFYEDRAICPLCRWGGNQPYTEGYKLPDGLKQHLSGHGRATRCSVMEIVFQTARDHAQSKEKR